MANESYIASIAGRTSDNDSLSPWLSLLDRQSMQDAGIYSPRDAAEVALSGHLRTNLSAASKNKMAAQFVNLGMQYVEEIKKYTDSAIDQLDVDYEQMADHCENEMAIQEGRRVLKNTRREIQSLAKEVHRVSPAAMKEALLAEFEEQWGNHWIRCDDRRKGR